MPTEVSIPADPSGFYTWRISKLIAESDGLERFFYQFFKAIDFGSIAIAFDPLSHFRFTPEKVAVINRMRVRRDIWHTLRTEVRKDASSGYSTRVVTETPNPWDLHPIEQTSSFVTNQSLVRSPQVTLLGFAGDTTSRTRPVDSHQGEFERFTTKIWSKGGGWGLITSKIDVWETEPWEATKINRTQTSRTRTMSGPRARFALSSHDNIVNNEKANSVDVILDNHLRLLGQCLPGSRTFGLGRSIAELRDFPRTVKSSLEQFIGRYSSRGLAAQPINYLFGWKPLINDIKKLVDLPEKTARRANYLLKRQGQPTTFRTSFSYEEPVTGTPAFTYEAMEKEINTSTTTAWSRKVTLRAMVNANVRLPLLEIPLFRGLPRAKLLALLKADQMGSLPRLVDLYRLIPWTWLEDWFSGLGEYVDVIEQINGDNNLINYGFITYLSNGVIRTSYRCDRQVTERLTVDGDELVNTTKLVPHKHESRLSYEYQLRKSFSSIHGLRMTSDPGSLTAYQASVIGALALAKR